MNKLHEGGSLAFTARVLGALFYYPPDTPDVAPLVEAFVSGDWVEQWPLPSQAVQPLAVTFATHSDEPLARAFQRLFVGPWALPAPPWGSVWMDRESVLFGDSTLALRQWMRENSIAFESQQNEPEDHFGTLLLLAAWLSENGRHTECEQLLAWHLLPWATRFLTLLTEHAEHPFYRALGELAQLTLKQWRDGLLIPVAQKQLYR
ncbi:Tat proofreading chaperone DmsD [Superficieibacter electus]|uniref:Tat proofreading chaperone DmsD n=1 Tax=Superficieibacter electus TaxID=2022662 RepID=A0A2P5GTW2_9ENTR|nr:Tat proofreading chaperone DmsD [Superficieibacter electus]POP47143.1 Tat proofreading chaperone DmsD [Superficieibacter electus]POP49989.1 Tat proofreading chaperone DmsD [Superficieibacter electus]